MPKFVVQSGVLAGIAAEIWQIVALYRYIALYSAIELPHISLYADP